MLTDTDWVILPILTQTCIQADSYRHIFKIHTQTDWLRLHGDRPKYEFRLIRLTELTHAMDSDWLTPHSSRQHSPNALRQKLNTHSGRNAPMLALTDPMSHRAQTHFSSNMQGQSHSQFKTWATTSSTEEGSHRFCTGSSSSGSVLGVVAHSQHKTWATATSAEPLPPLLNTDRQAHRLGTAEQYIEGHMAEFLRQER